MATIQATVDVPEGATEALADDCQSLLHITAHIPSRGLFSDAPPSFVRLVAEYAEWAAILKLSAGAFLTAFSAKLGKDAATDLWKHKAKIAESLASTGAAALRTLVAALRRMKQAVPSRTYAAAVLPIPGEHFGAVMVIPTESEEDAALALAVFLDQLEVIDGTIRDELAAGRSFVHGVRILPRPDGSVLLVWVDRASNETRERLLEARLDARDRGPEEDA